MVRRTHRTASAVLAVTTALTLSSPAFAAPSSPEHGEAAELAAGWLAGELVDGERIDTTFDGATYPDQGLTADVVLALAGAGVGADAIAAATDWLETQVAAYTGSADDDVYAGAVAKLLLVAETTGRTATDLGGADLVAMLEGQEQGSGRYADTSAWGDYSTTISQSLAVLGLQRTTGTAPSDVAVDYLAAQACEDGGYPQDLELAAEDCTGDVDSTAFAVQALLAVGRDEPARDAVAWLLAQQGADGGFGGGGAAANANSTGLAATALHAAGEDDAVAASRGFLLGLLAGCDDEAPGSIRYDRADAGDRTRATAQAVLGLVDVGLATVTASGAATAVPGTDCDPGGTADPEPGPSPEDADAVDDGTGGDAPQEGTEAAPGELPRTGDAAAWAALLGVVLVAAGTLVLRHPATSHR